MGVDAKNEVCGAKNPNQLTACVLPKGHMGGHIWQPVEAGSPTMNSSMGLTIQQLQAHKEYLSMKIKEAQKTIPDSQKFLEFVTPIAVEINEVNKEIEQAYGSSSDAMEFKHIPTLPGSTWATPSLEWSDLGITKMSKAQEMLASNIWTSGVDKPEPTPGQWHGTIGGIVLGKTYPQAELEGGVYMTKKHFAAIATILAKNRPHPDMKGMLQLWEGQRDELSKYFKTLTQSFDTQKFKLLTEAKLTEDPKHPGFAIATYPEGKKP